MVMADSLEAALEAAIRRFDGTSPVTPQVHQYFGYAGDAAGAHQRLRMQLVLEVVAEEGGSAERGLDVASAVEILHNSTLVHDAVEDGARSLFGLAHGINAGDALCAMAYLQLLEGPSRIGDLAFEGRPLAPDETFLVVTNNHRAGGSGLYAGMTGVELVISAPDTNRDALVRYVREERLLTPPDRASWRFRPIEDASALFETGPGARAHADAATAAGLEFVGPGENGFERWRKRFG